MIGCCESAITTACACWHVFMPGRLHGSQKRDRTQAFSLPSFKAHEHTSFAINQAALRAPRTDPRSVQPSAQQLLHTGRVHRVSRRKMGRRLSPPVSRPICPATAGAAAAAITAIPSMRCRPLLQGLACTRRQADMTFDVKIKKWHAVASWTWNAGGAGNTPLLGTLCGRLSARLHLAGKPRGMAPAASAPSDDSVLLTAMSRDHQLIGLVLACPPMPC